MMYYVRDFLDTVFIGIMAIIALVDFVDRKRERRSSNRDKRRSKK